MSARPLTADAEGLPLLTMLGIDPEGVAALTLRLEAGTVPTVTIVRYLRVLPGDADEWAKTVERYVLSPRPDILP